MMFEFMRTFGAIVAVLAWGSASQDVRIPETVVRGVLYGKTGSGKDNSGANDLGWYVGYVESRGKTYAFACLVRGGGVAGKDARVVVETVLTKPGFL